MTVRNEVLMKLGGIGPNEFETLCCHLLSKVKEIYKDLEPTTNRDGKTTKGAADAYKRLSDGSYIFCIFTTKQTKVKDKIIRDMEKIANVGMDVGRVVLCLNTAINIEQHTAYIRTAQKYSWDIDIYSLHKLSDILLSYPELLEEFLNIRPYTIASLASDEVGFLIGERLRAVREELSLQTSEMVELIGFPSEKLYLRMEANEQECSVSMLSQIYEATGILPEWLKHGSWKKCEVDGLSWWQDPYRSVQSLADLSPSFIYVTAVTTIPRSDIPLWGKLKDLHADARDRYLHVGLCVQVSRFRYKTYDFYLCMNFWSEIRTDLIPRFYNFIGELIECFGFDVRGVIIPSWKDDYDLYNGRVHPEKIISKYYDLGTGWVHDIMDIWHRHSSALHYSKIYGYWFTRVQSEFRTHLYG